MEGSPERRFRDRWFLAGASLLFLALVAGGLFLWRRNVAAKTKPPEPVAQAPVEAAPGAAELSFSAPVQARNLVAIPSPIEGTLEIVEVEEGGEVEEGQTIGRIKNLGLESSQQAAQEEFDRIQSRIDNLESGLISARLEASRAAADSDRLKSEFERADKSAQREQLLFREGATPRLRYEKAQKDMESVRAEYDAARHTARVSEERVVNTARDLEAAKRQLEEKQKSLEGAKADLQAAEVKSPASGLFLGAKVKPGEEVDPSMEDLFRVAVNPIELMVRFEADPKAAEKLKAGLEASVQILEYSGDAIPGELTQDEEGHWRVEFLAPDPMIKPGLNASVKIKLQ